MLHENTLAGDKIIFTESEKQSVMGSFVQGNAYEVAEVKRKPYHADMSYRVVGDYGDSTWIPRQTDAFINTNPQQLETRYKDLLFEDAVKAMPLAELETIVNICNAIKPLKEIKSSKLQREHVAYVRAIAEKEMTWRVLGFNTKL